MRLSVNPLIKCGKSFTSKQFFRVKLPKKNVFTARVSQKKRNRNFTSHTALHRPNESQNNENLLSKKNCDQIPILAKVLTNPCLLEVRVGY